MAKPGQSPSKDWLDSAKKKLNECAAAPDCNARVACMKDITRPGQGKK